MRQRVCGGIAYSDLVTLEIQKNGERHGTKFFKYERNSSDPDIIWPSRELLVVNIADVGQVYEKQQNIDGIRIRYEIGNVGASTVPKG